MEIRIVFIVDDNETDCLIAKVLLEKTIPQVEIHCFCSPRLALETLQFRNISHKQALPDVIFLDLEMPLMSGWDFMEEYAAILQNSACKPSAIYLLTCSIRPQDRERARRHPLIEDLLVKPFTKNIRIHRVKQP